MPNISEFTIIDRVLNMSQTIYSVRSIYNFMRDGRIQNPVKDL